MELRYLVPLSEEGDGPPTFIVPSAGATFFSFVTLARTLKAPGPIYSFSLTELQVSDAVHSTMEEIAKSLLQELRTAKPHGPYTLAGHCFGGVMALEMAAQLEADGEAVDRLLLLESFVPLKAGATQGTGSSDLEGYANTMQGILDQTLDDARAKLARMPKQHADRIVALTARQIETGNNYDPSTIKAPIRLFRSSVHGDAAFRGWEALTSGGFSERPVPGDTHSMLEKPHISALCQEMEAFQAETD